MIDLHVHTHHSCDANASIEEYCKKAIHLGLKYICFTDHVDCNPADYGYGYYKANKFFDEFNRARDKYSEKLHLLSGIEFSEPHKYEKEFANYTKIPYDFILGSVHYWIGDLFASEMVKNKYPIQKAFERYWEEVHTLVSFVGFDSIAHLDFPKRYFKESYWSQEQLQEIFRLMVKNNIALEINTSSLRKGLTESMPGKELLDLYERAGGTKITIGSDAHSAADLSSGYDHAYSLLSGKLESTVFIKRKPRKLISDTKNPINEFIKKNDIVVYKGDNNDQ